ncbi:hypothetical protein PP175_01795 [Aneurinibacillus sp. Ricciae_BoGa-3]|uniref:DUF2521 family protein n=1 Tax=Aneurinibacillus sp. Ricciae_BoGa-3 TaxID=3022697 RepID=UPI00234039D2|nr:hypothetical protein [Aneurinibacillus sp. Ricciae_BoGa-3]WCK54795.1 hypothetical protein PP175_01795 [Aneurinibacillus sp. Ricciae_BoGa-3]
MDNIVSFEQWSQNKVELLKERVVHGIDREEVKDYYRSIVSHSVGHMTLLQRYTVEQYLLEVLSEFFYLGAQASKQYRLKRTEEEIEQSVSGIFFDKLCTLAAEFHINRYLGEWDAYSISIIAEDLAAKWFRKGFTYGQKLRKLRLL